MGGAKLGLFVFLAFFSVLWRFLCGKRHFDGEAGSISLPNKAFSCTTAFFGPRGVPPPPPAAQQAQAQPMDATGSPPPQQQAPPAKATPLRAAAAAMHPVVCRPAHRRSLLQAHLSPRSRANQRDHHQR